MSELDELNINVAMNIAEHSEAMDVEKAHNGFAVYDVIATMSLAKYCDGLVTAPTGVYGGVPFVTQSRSVTHLAEFVGWIISHHDNDVKLLYMAQAFIEPIRPDFDTEPLTYLIRYAIIKNVDIKSNSAES